MSIRAETLPVDSRFGLIGHGGRRGLDGVEIAEAPGRADAGFFLGATPALSS